MNKIKATITQIQSFDGVTIVTFKTQTSHLKMMALELSQKIKDSVFLAINPSNIAIGKEFDGIISFSNILDVKLIKIELGELLATLFLSFEDEIFEAIITKDSCEKMNLQINDNLKAFIKASHISIIESKND